MNRTDLNRSPVHLLHRAAQCVGEVFGTVIGKENLTPRQLIVLATVGGNEGLSSNRHREPHER